MLCYDGNLQRDKKKKRRKATMQKEQSLPIMTA